MDGTDLHVWNSATSDTKEGGFADVHAHTWGTDVVCLTIGHFASYRHPAIQQRALTLRAALISFYNPHYYSLSASSCFLPLSGAMCLSALWCRSIWLDVFMRVCWEWVMWLWASSWICHAICLSICLPACLESVLCMKFPWEKLNLGIRTLSCLPQTINAPFNIANLKKCLKLFFWHHLGLLLHKPYTVCHMQDT